jgi:uncharacterized protein YuzE
MRIRYFSDTDTAHIEFTDKLVHETKEISENIYVDVDEKGNIVSMTIEHDKANAGLWEFSYQEMSGQAASKMQNISFEKDVSYDGASLEPISIGVIWKLLDTYVWYGHPYAYHSMRWHRENNAEHWGQSDR